MTTTQHYAKSWFRYERRPTELWDEARAREAHAARKQYVVVVGPLDHPAAFLELNRDFVGVSFLDERLREYLGYSFQEKEPGRLFLSVATYREFVGDTDKVKEGTTHIFKPDGGLAIHHELFDPPKLEVAKSTTDVQGNYELYPEFGSYGHLLVKERGLGR